MKRLAVLLVLSLAALGLRAEFPDRFVEYIESDGSQYIDLGDVLRSNTVAVIDFMRITTDTVERPMFGASSSFAYLATTRRYVRNKLRSSGPDANIRYLYRYDVARPEIYYSTDGGATWPAVGGNSYAGNEGAGASAYLFGASGSTKSKAAMRVYGCSITNGTSLVCDLYPCVKNGVPGLYDAVTGDVLFDSAASATAFAVGPDVDIPPACLSCGYEIKGVPSRWGMSVPAYGIAACERDSSVSFTLNGLDGEGWVLSADGKSRARFDGATYRPYGGEVEEIGASSFTRTLSGVAEVVWKFGKQQYACIVNASAIGEATYWVDGAAVQPGTTLWVDAESSVKVKIVPAFGFSFVKWTDGEHDLGTEPEITVTPGASGLNLTPVLRPYICVNKDSTSATEDGSPENPYKTIQAGIDAARYDGDEIVVYANAYPATYAINTQIVGNENYKGLLVHGLTGNPRNIVIDAGKTGRCLKFTDGSTVSDLTLTNGFLAFHQPGDEFAGGGAYLSGGSSMDNCVVTDCHIVGDYGLVATEAASLGGGGVYAEGVSKGSVVTVSGSRIEDCSVVETSSSMKKNQTVYGGGIWAAGATTLTNTVVRGCRIVFSCGKSDGYAYGGGVGIYTAISTPNVILVGCDVSDNVVTNTIGQSTRMFGGGYSCQNRASTAPVICNSVFSNNFSLSRGAAINFETTGCTIRGCELVGNRSADSVIVYGAKGFFCTNTLFAANTGASIVMAGSNMSLGIGSCTFASNTAATLTVDGTPATTAVRNTILANDSPAELPDDLLEGGSYAANVDHCYIGGNPKFVSRSRGDYRIRYSSPCRGQGLVEPWMTDAKALDGSPRIDPVDGTVDIGAYQHTPFVGFSIQVK